MAAQGRNDQILRFLVQAEGEDALKPFIKSVKDLEGASDETKKAADELLTELSEASKLKASVDNYGRLKDSVEALGTKSDAAKLKVDQLSKEIEESAAPTKKQQEAFDIASSAAKRLEVQLQRQREALAIVRAGLQVAGVSTDDFGKAQADVTAKATAARVKLEELAKSAGQYTAKTDQAATETNQFADKLGILRKGFEATKQKLGEIAEGVGGLSTKFTELNQATELAGKVLGTLGSIGNFLGDQINEVGAFELALAKVEVRTRATADESKLLRKAIADALQTSAVSAGAAAEALRLMAEDGASATESAQNLGQAVAYAQANTRGLSETVQGLGAVLDAFDEGPARIGALADSITATAAAAGTSTKAIEDGLAGVGVAADQAGLSLDETVAMIGVLAQRGVEGTRAGAQLTKVLQQLADPATKAGEALKTAGIDGSDLSGVLQRLSTDSVLAEQVLSALGARPRAALKLLLADGGKSLEGFTEAVRNASGATQEASDIMGDKFALALDRAAASIENARNTFLEPILEPLAQELNKFATEFNTFAQSPEFARLSDQFRRVATQGIQALGDLARSVDFEAAAGRIGDFAESTISAMQSVAAAINFTAGAFGTVWDSATALGAGAVQLLAAANSELVGSFAEVSDTANEVSASYAAIAVDAGNLRDEALTSLGTRFGLTSEEARKFGDQLDQVAAKADQAKLNLDALAKALPKNDIAAIAARWGLLKKPLDDIADGGEKAGAGLDKARAAAIAAGLAFERMQVGVLLNAMDKLMRSGLQTSDTYKALNAEFLAAEGRINALTAEQQELSGANDQVTNSANRAADAVRNYGNAAGSAADAAGRSSESNSQVAQSFGNIANQSSSTAISLGNLTEAFVRQAMEAAGAAGSIREYIRTWNDFIASAADEDKAIADRIDQLNRQNAALDEEAKIRRRLELQYGTSSTRLEELIQLELKLAQAKRERNKESEREIEIEERRAQVAGGLNYGSNAASDSSASSGGSASGGKSTTVELVLRNETNATGQTARLSTDQLSTIARTVVEALRLDLAATGR